MHTHKEISTVLHPHDLLCIILLIYLLIFQFKTVHSFTITSTDLQRVQLNLAALNFNVTPVLLLRLEPIESAALMTVLL